jgi:hypothetical protein
MSLYITHVIPLNNQSPCDDEDGDKIISHENCLQLDLSHPFVFVTIGYIIKIIILNGEDSN